MPAIITLKQLEDVDACWKQRLLFREKFGESVEVTRELCVSVADLFYWDWAAEEFLTAAAWAEYDKAKAAAWAEYDKARTAAWPEYVKAMAAAFADAYIGQQGET